MITNLIQWLIVVILVSLLYWVIAQIAPAPIQRVVLVVCVVIVVLALIFLILPIASVHLLR